MHYCVTYHLLNINLKSRLNEKQNGKISGALLKKKERKGNCYLIRLIMIDENQITLTINEKQKEIDQNKINTFNKMKKKNRANINST